MKPSVSSSATADTTPASNSLGGNEISPYAGTIQAIGLGSYKTSVSTKTRSIKLALAKPSLPKILCFHYLW